MNNNIVLNIQTLSNPKHQKGLYELFTKGGYSSFGIYVHLLHILKNLKVTTIEEHDIIPLSMQLAIPPSSLRELLKVGTSLKSPIFTEHDYTYTLVTGEKKVVDKPLVDSYPPGRTDVFLRLSAKEVKLLTDHLGEKEFKYIANEVEDWLKDNKKGQSRASHLGTIKTFIRRKQERGLQFTTLIDPPGYYPTYRIDKITSQY